MRKLADYLVNADPDSYALEGYSLYLHHTFGDAERLLQERAWRADGPSNSIKCGSSFPGSDVVHDVTIRRYRKEGYAGSGLSLFATTGKPLLSIVILDNDEQLFVKQVRKATQGETPDLIANSAFIFGFGEQEQYHELLRAVIDAKTPALLLPKFKNNQYVNP